jgi:cytochrome c oxidase assembly protein subunit 15
MSSPADPVPAPPSVSPVVVRRLAWSTLVFTTAIVVISGAVVRATDSGAGCGESWPRCDGRLFPLSTGGATAVEFSHRLLTAALFVALLALIVVVRRHHPRDHRVRRALNWSLVFFFGEVLIGAVLVLFGWVEDDASAGRAIAVTIHLVNTFFLIGAMTLMAHFSSGGAGFRPSLARKRDRLALIGAATVLIVAASGALNALADTLYPAGSVIDGVRAELVPDAPFLLRLRTIHPVVAVGGAGLLFILTRAPSMAGPGVVRRRGAAVQIILGVQIMIGIVNVALLTPLEIQVLHLLTADLLWIMWVLYGTEAIAAWEARTHAVEMT